MSVTAGLVLLAVAGLAVGEIAAYGAAAPARAAAAEHQRVVDAKVATDYLPIPHATPTPVVSKPAAVTQADTCGPSEVRAGAPLTVSFDGLVDVVSDTAVIAHLTRGPGSDVVLSGDWMSTDWLVMKTASGTELVALPLDEAAVAAGAPTVEVSVAGGPVQSVTFRGCGSAS